MPGGTSSAIWCSMSAGQLLPSCTRARNQAEVCPLRVANRSHVPFPAQMNPQAMSPSKVPTFGAAGQSPVAKAWLTSQPFPVSPSQFEYPELQPAIAHDPVEQVGLAFGRLQGTPHPPQLVRVVSEVSHPFCRFASQLFQPEEQTGEQAPPTHAVVPWGFVQASPHDPQLPVSVARLRQTLEQQAPLKQLLPDEQPPP